MIEFDKEKIFNGSPTKMLRNQYEALKQDYTKYNAMKYSQVYSEMALSDILDGSQYIFAEPMRGCAFYKDLMESCLIPYDRMEEEYDKVSKYFNENSKKMSNTMIAEYTDLLGVMERMLDSTKNTRMMYEAFYSNSHGNDKYYEVHFNRDDGVLGEEYANDLFLEDANTLKLIDAITFGVKRPEINDVALYKYLTEEALIEDPKTPAEYKLNAYTTNVVRRMMKDKYISEAVNSLENMNLRTLLRGLAKEDQSEYLESVVMESHSMDEISYSTDVDSVNMLFDEADSNCIFAESDALEKMNRLACEKAIVDINESFLAMDAIYGVSADSTANWDPIVEKLCIESSTISKVPTDISEQVSMLKNLSDSLVQEYAVAYEKYYSDNGEASSVIRKEIGEVPEYTPKKASKVKKDQDADSEDDDQDSDMDNEDEPEEDDSDNNHEESDEEREAKRKAKKDAATAKYAAMDVGDVNFNEASEDEEEEDNKKKSGKATSDAKASPAKKDDEEEANDDEEPEDDDKSSEDDSSDKSAVKNEKSQKVEKPQKRSLAQRIQNKALDANAKFHKTLSNIKRKNIDRKNAAKAVGKVPGGIAGMLKKQVSDWEEMDDNKRKEYIIKPGTRKKYFRALKIAIEHYIAFAINPLMNIVLMIVHHFSHEKDVRIRNELIHELKTEQEVIKAKISDMQGDPKMNSERYKLMRFKDKLDAEIVRVSANSKYV